MPPRLPPLTIDLDRDPRDRWVLGDEHLRAAGDLLRLYNRDLGLDSGSIQFVAEVAEDVVPNDQWLEMGHIACALDAPLAEVLVANLHYDLLKVALGCTAFAVDTPTGPLHARNLDWWTRDRRLQEATVVCHFLNGPLGAFVTVGWPAFVGAMSGVAEGRFAITLNAVLSHEDGQVSTPVVCLIRQVLETAPNFARAVEQLSSQPIATDCLLLVTGTRPGEAVVIERTPGQCATRHASPAEPLRVTNDYRRIDADTGDVDDQLATTSCRRFDRVGELLAAATPETPEQALLVLDDPAVRMDLTVQQMIFRAATGKISVRVP